MTAHRAAPVTTRADWDQAVTVDGPELPELWAVHVRGSDDIIPAATRADAERMRAACEVLDAGRTSEVTPRLAAVVIAWPDTPESHAEALAADAEDGVW